MKKLLLSLVKNILNITEKDMKLGRVAELNENWRNSIKKEKKKMYVFVALLHLKIKLIKTRYSVILLT